MTKALATKTALVAVPLLAAILAAPAANADGDRMGRSGHSPAAMSSNSDKVVSGGVGLGARDEMRQRTENYELKLVFAATPSGDYLAEIPVTITDRGGNTVVEAVSDGPWMFIDLPSGTYSVQARYNGRTETRQVSVTSGAQRVVYVRFPNAAGNVVNVSSAR